MKPVTPFLLALLAGLPLHAVARGSIELVGQLNPAANSAYGDIWGEGDYAYIGTQREEGVFIIDISDAAQPIAVSNYPGNVLQDVKVQDGVAYFASNDGDGVHIVDVSNPADPTLLSHLPIGNVHNLSVNGNLMYTAAGFGRRIGVFDVSDPLAPEFIRTIDVSSSQVHDMTALGNRMYASSFGGTTDIFDVSDITNPVLLGTISSGSASHSNWVTDDGRILASAREMPRGGVTLFDIANPSEPILLARLLARNLGFAASSPHNPLIREDILYVSWYEAGLQIFDIADSSHPIHLGGFDTISNWGVYPFLGRDRILLSDRLNGLLIVDVTRAVPEPTGLGMTCLAWFGIGRIRRRTASIPRGPCGAGHHR